MNNYDSILSDSLSRIKTPPKVEIATLTTTNFREGSVCDEKGNRAIDFRALTAVSSCGNIVDFVCFYNIADRYGLIMDGVVVCQCEGCHENVLGKLGFPVSCLFHDQLTSAFDRIETIFSKNHISDIHSLASKIPLLRPGNFSLESNGVFALIQHDTSAERKIRGNSLFSHLLSRPVQ